MRTGRIVSGLIVAALLQTAVTDTAVGAPTTSERTASTSAVPLKITVRKGLLTAELAGAPLSRVLHEIARASRVRIVLRTPSDEPITAKLHALPLKEGLRRILHNTNFVFMYTREPDESSHAALREVHVYSSRDNRQSPVTAPFEARGSGAPATAGAQPARSLAEAPHEADPMRFGEGRAEARATTWDAGEEVIGALARRVLEDEETEARERAATALGKTWSDDAVQPLAHALLGDPHAFVREAAAQALGETWSTAALEPLTQALTADQRRSVREKAAEALGEIGDTGAAQALIAALRDHDLSVRESAAQALGRLGGLDAAEALMALVLNESEDSWLRQAAEASLRKIWSRAD